MNEAPVARGGPAGERLRRCFEIAGRVQGVGFRPFLFRLARRLELNGRVYNNPGGVVLDVEGSSSKLDSLPALIRTGAPPAARVDRIDERAREPAGFATLKAAGSETSPPGRAGEPGAAAEAAPDLAPCVDCLTEIQDPRSRRFGYVFTSCTACGPRFTILDALPYDRVRTSMRRFLLCDDCHDEYTNPTDRRFHHEANCCPRCGPRLELRDSAGELIAAAPGDAGDLLARVERAVQAGRTVALKGVGGYQLLASAVNPDALAGLRRAKGRPRKPFALLVPDITAARRLLYLSPEEERALRAPQAPILIARARPEAVELIALDRIAPGSPFLGVMLPASPLHRMLAERTGAVVCTSGNRESEPIFTDDAGAHGALKDIADLFLTHDRAILRHADDSVVRVMGGRRVVLRRARGFAPAPLVLPEGVELPATLALGAQLKNAPAIGAGRRILLGQHVGDLDTRPVLQLFRRTADDLCRLSGITPRRVACDLHPDYASTREAERRAGQNQKTGTGGEPVRVQHHLAHVLAVLAENGIVPGVGPGSAAEAILGVAWDGTGYGTDHSMWGGEFFLLKGSDGSRVGSLRSMALPGGEQAIRDPGRITLAMLDELAREEPSLASVAETLPCFAGRSAAEVQVLRKMLANGLNVPSACGAGRLFDAFAALLGIADEVTFEGEAAMALEYSASLAERAADPLPFPLESGDLLSIDWRPAWKRALELIGAGTEPGVIAHAFHEGLAEAIRAVAARLQVDRVALSGGCFQNQLLLERAKSLLEGDGRAVYFAHEIPPGDGGLAVGQIIAARSANSNEIER